MTGTPVRTVFLGSGAFAVPALRALAGDRRVAIVGVVTAPPRPAGRSGTLRPTPVADAAAALGLAPILTPERLRDPVAISAVLDLQPSLAVLADYGQIVPPSLLDLPHGALNLHPSLLPRHRGATPVPATILAGDDESGVTLMRMDAGLDTGPIVAQARVPLTGAETGPELEARLAAVGADLLTAHLGPWVAGELDARPQPDEGVSFTHRLRRDDGRLDPDRPAHELERRVRALEGWPGTFVELPGGRRLKVWRAAVLPPLPAQEPRTLTVDDGDGVALTTPDGRLALLEVQAPGGRRISGAEFRRGLAGRGIVAGVLGRLA